MRDTTVILNRVSLNPHRPGSLDARRWALIQPGMTVGEFVRVHNATGLLDVGGLGSDWHAKRYLKYMVQRGLMELPGETFVTRGPRVFVTSPLSTDLSVFTFGVELECLLPRGMSRATAAAQVTAETGVDVREEGYNHTTRNWWKVTTDGSLGDYSRGSEFVSPILRGAEGLEQVEKVCRALKALGAKVTKSCGLHVHVGAPDEEVDFFRNVARLYGRNEEVINSVLPVSRRNSMWARPVRLSRINDRQSKQELLEAIGGRPGTRGERYYKVNFNSYWFCKTVEFRQHSGTVEADKASFWVKFCLRMALAAKAGKSAQVANLGALMSEIGATEDETNYFNRRAATFAAS